MRLVGPGSGALPAVVIAVVLIAGCGVPPERTMPRAATALPAASPSPAERQAVAPTILASDEGARALVPLVDEVLREVMERTAEQLRFRPEHPLTVHVATELESAIEQSREHGSPSSEATARAGRSFAVTQRDASGRPRSHRIVLNLIYPDQRERSRVLVTLAHEYTHVAQQGLPLATTGGSPLPRWFEEGQAVYQAQRLAGTMPVELALAVRDQRASAAPRLAELIESRDWVRGEATHGVGVVYSRSYVAVRYLAERYGADAIVQLIRESRGSQADFRDRLAALTSGDTEALDHTVGEWLTRVPHIGGVAEGGARTDVVADPADGRARAVVTFTRDLACPSGRIFKAGEYFASSPFAPPRPIGRESGRPATGASPTGPPLWLHGVVSQMLTGVSSSAAQPGLVLALAPEQSLNVSWSNGSRGTGQTVSLFARYRGTGSLDGAVVAADPTIGCTHEPLLFGSDVSPVTLEAAAGLRLDGVRFDDVGHVQFRLSAMRDLPCRGNGTIARAQVFASGYVDLRASVPIQIWSGDMLTAYGRRPADSARPVQAVWLDDLRGCTTGWLTLGPSLGSGTVAATTDDGTLDLLFMSQPGSRAVNALLITTSRDPQCGEAHPDGRRYFATYQTVSLRPDNSFSSRFTLGTSSIATVSLQGTVENPPDGISGVRGQYRYMHRSSGCDSGSRDFRSAPP